MYKKNIALLPIILTSALLFTQCERKDIYNTAENKPYTLLSYELSEIGFEVPGIATITGQPAGVNNITALNVDIAGTDVLNYQYKVGSTATTDCSNSTGYSAAIAVSANITDNISGLSDGSITLCVIGQNSASTWQLFSDATTSTWTKDTIAPAVAITAPNGGADFTTNVASQTLSGTCGTDTTLLSVSGGHTFSDSNCADGTWALNPITLAENANIITVTATDANANAAAATQTITLDTTPPAVAITAPNGGADFTTNVASQTLSGTCGTDATLSVSGGHTFGDSNCADGTWALNPITLAENANIITVTATDANANAAAATQTITLDTTPPSVAITAPNGGADFTTTTALQTLSGTCGTDATLSVSGGHTFGDSNCADGTWALNPITLAENANIITVTATDANANAAAATQTITLDTTPPAVAITAPNGGADFTTNVASRPCRAPAALTRRFR